MDSKITPETYAFFDFDGTLTTRDTLYDFLYFIFGLRLAGIFLRFLPYAFLYFIRVQGRSKTKEKLLALAFKGFRQVDFNAKCEDYCRSRLPVLIRENVTRRVRWHLESGHKVAIVSASCENWIQPWASAAGIEYVLATQLEFKNNVFTGHFASPNCTGIEKVNRIHGTFDIRENDILYGYGDSNGDREMLAICKHSHLKSFPF